MAIRTLIEILTELENKKDGISTTEIISIEEAYYYAMLLGVIGFVYKTLAEFEVIESKDKVKA